MRHRPGAPGGRPGVGQFAGRRDPQDADLTPLEELQDAMMGDGGLRVALTTASNRVFHGSDLSPQVFLAPPTHPNDPTSLQLAASAGIGNSRSALNRRRGA
jgi:hypothetical protein